jgi:hypothetical protein
MECESNNKSFGKSENIKNSLKLILIRFKLRIKELIQQSNSQNTDKIHYSEL